MARRTPPGITVRHKRPCRSRTGGVCNCRPTYEAWVYLAREGKKVRQSFPTMAAAKSWRADSVGAAARGKLRAPTGKTVEIAAEEFLAGARSGAIPNRSGATYKPAAIRGYERGLRLRVLPAIGHMKLHKVTRADVQQLADRLTSDGVSASTVQNTLDPLRVIFRRAIRRDEVAIDPTTNLELRRPRGRRDRIATPLEATRLLAALAPDERVLYATAFYAGLRRGELRALRWKDVDLDAAVIHVERAWDDKEGEQGVKSEAGVRDVPILAPLLPLLVELGLRSLRIGEDLVFGTSAQVPFTPTTVRDRAARAWTAANAALGEDEPAMDPIGLHEGRHVCASILIASGANPKVIQKVMGHGTIQMTFDVYGHLMPGGLDIAAAAANAYLATSVA